MSRDFDHLLGLSRRIALAAMAERLLQDGSVALFDDDDEPLVRDRTLYRGSNGYVYVYSYPDRDQLLHRLLMGFPDSLIDHRDGNPLNNRRSNLREATSQQNQINRHRLNRNNGSGIRGVHLDAQTGRWRAQITVNRKNIQLGRFAELGEAIAARRAAELEHYGELCPA
jgi:hypothetical protein